MTRPPKKNNKQLDEVRGVSEVLDAFLGVLAVIGFAGALAFGADLFSLILAGIGAFGFFMSRTLRWWQEQLENDQDNE